MAVEHPHFYQVPDEEPKGRRWCQTSDQGRTRENHSIMSGAKGLEQFAQCFLLHRQTNAQVSKLRATKQTPQLAYIRSFDRRLRLSFSFSGIQLDATFAACIKRVGSRVWGRSCWILFFKSGGNTSIIRKTRENQEFQVRQFGLSDLELKVNFAEFESISIQLAMEERSRTSQESQQNAIGKLSSLIFAQWRLLYSHRASSMYRPCSRFSLYWFCLAFSPI